MNHQSIDLKWTICDVEGFDPKAPSSINLVVNQFKGGYPEYKKDIQNLKVSLKW